MGLEDARPARCEGIREVVSQILNLPIYNRRPMMYNIIKLILRRDENIV